MSRVVPKRSKSLNEILGIRAAPEPDDWPLAHRLFRAGSSPLEDLSDWDLGLLLRQRRGASHVLPIAFERLERDLWNEAGLYPGALLIAALRNRRRLDGFAETERRLEELAQEARARCAELSDFDREAFAKELDRVMAETEE